MMIADLAHTLPVWSLPTERSWQAATAPLSGLTVFDCIVVGGGAIGLSAAARCVEAGLTTVVIEAGDIGGHATLATPSGGGERCPGTEVDRLAKSVVVGGGRLSPQTRALGFGRIGSTWVVSTTSARARAQRLIVAPGALVDATRSFAPDLARGMVVDRHWTLASEDGAGLPFRALAARCDVGVGPGLHTEVDARGRLIIGGLAARSLSDAARRARASLGVVAPQLTLPPIAAGTSAMVVQSLPGSVIAGTDAVAVELGPLGFAVVHSRSTSLADGTMAGATAADLVLGRTRSKEVLVPREAPATGASARRGWAR